jgi:hypothetical protein
VHFVTFKQFIPAGPASPFGPGGPDTGTYTGPLSRPVSGSPFPKMETIYEFVIMKNLKVSEILRYLVVLVGQEDLEDK